ncbi:hypothetical protein LCGC14_0303320 [marine sediment metagenome]|uniref:Glycosyltransferase 2-like domain-containing protein n=1 Tax=marine sediment metagenome TaxID=412755 RepID=A0A0F9WBB1_9ZZZZ
MNCEFTLEIGLCGKKASHVINRGYSYFLCNSHYFDEKIIVIMIGKNEEKTIGAAIDSLHLQNHPPVAVLYVDDGSTDKSVQIANIHVKHFEYGRVIERPYRINGPYLVGQPAMANLINLGLYQYKYSEDIDYFMIMNASIYLPTGYIENLLQKFREDKYLAIASGSLQINGVGINKHAPSGAGRMIKTDFLDRYSLNRCLPIYYGWESEIMSTAMRMGRKVDVFQEIEMYSLKGLRQKKLNYIHWGRAMRALGYSFVSMLVRAVLMTGARKTPKPAVQLIAGYFSSYWTWGNLTNRERERVNATRKWYRKFEIKHKANKALHIISSKLF